MSRTRLRPTAPLVLAALAAAAAGSRAQTPSPPSAQVRLAFDRNYLYAAWTVDDSHVDASVRGTSPATWPKIAEDDAVAVHLMSGARTVGLVVNAAGGYAFLEGGKPVPFFGIKFAPTVRGTLERSGDVDRGYVIETAIPWSALGLPAGADPATLAPSLRLVAHKRGASPTHWPAPAAADGSESWQTLSLAGGPGRPVPTAPADLRIDGALGPDEWSDAAIGFDVPDPKPDRTPPVQPLDLSPLRPADLLPPIATPVDDSLAAVRPVFARALVGLNADLLKRSAPPRGIFSPQGGYAAVDHPVAGFGPWVSSDRVGWHREQLMGMARAGVDIAWTVTGPDRGETAPFDAKALTVLAAAGKELRREGAKVPGLAPAVEFPSESESLDLASASGRDRLYAAVARWFQLVPPSQVARVRVPVEGGSQLAIPVSIGPSSALRNADGDWHLGLRERFATEFGASFPGTTLAFVGDEAAPAGPAFVGRLGASGPVRVDRVRPGSMMPFRPRKFGETYKSAWEAAKDAAWVLVDSWNDYAAATEIAPTRQYGDGFIGLTRLFKSTFEPSRVASAEVALGEPDLPVRLRPGQIVPIDIPLRNTSPRPLSTSDVELSYRWIAADGTVVEGANKGRPAAPLAPGVEGSVRLAVTTVGAGNSPLSVGEHRLEIVVRHPGGQKRFARSTTIASTDSVEILSTTLPSLVRSGSEIPASLRFRLSAPEGIPAGKARLVWQILGEGKVLAAGQQALDRAVPAGVWNSVSLLVRTIGTTGEAVPPAYPEKQAEGDPNPAKWGHRIRWALLRDDGTAIDGGLEESLAVYPPADSARIEVLSVPEGKPIHADSLLPVRVRVTNLGSERWAKGQVALTGRWFQADGFPMALVAALPTLPLSIDVAPGESLEIEVPVRTPLRMGRYVVGVFATRPPDGFFALAPITGTSDTGFARLDVIGGKTVPVDLGAVFDTDAVASEPQPRDGDLDGSGATLPAEWFPSDRNGLAAGAAVIPSGFYTDITSDIVRSALFAYGSAEPGRKNAVSARGQTLPVPAGRAIAVHVAATATGASPAELTLVLRHRDGKHETVKRTLKPWRDSPQSGEALALRVPRVRTPGGDIATPAALQHLVVPVAPGF
ncbi:MAG: hypothetical protein ACKO5K_10040, partial [Armatimonadota bacterium]